VGPNEAQYGPPVAETAIEPFREIAFPVTA
jgi:hypothetical protein